MSNQKKTLHNVNKHLAMANAGIDRTTFGKGRPTIVMKNKKNASTLVRKQKFKTPLDLSH